MIITTLPFVTLAKLWSTWCAVFWILYMYDSQPCLKCHFSYLVPSYPYAAIWNVFILNYTCSHYNLESIFPMHNWLDIMLVNIFFFTFLRSNHWVLIVLAPKQWKAYYLGSLKTQARLDTEFIESVLNDALNRFVCMAASDLPNTGKRPGMEHKFKHATNIACVQKHMVVFMLNTTSAGICVP
jgi:hypothetical protein